MKSKEPNLPQLKRTLSFTQLVFYGVGTILGLGIYVLLGEIGGESGTLMPMAFLLAAVLASFTGLSYGELSARIPKSAGEVNYVERAFNRSWLSSLVGWLIILSAMISTATVVNGYVGYIQEYIDSPSWIIITLFVLILGAVAIKGISESVRLITIITIVEILGIVLFIIIAGDRLGDVPERWPELLPSSSLSDWKHIMAGSFLAFFAFIGFEDMVNLAEEVKQPEKNMPRAIAVSIAIISVLYLLVATIASLELSATELAQSDAPLAEILGRRGEIYPHLISAIGLVAIVNGVLVQIVMGSRVLYGMAAKNMAPQILGRIHQKTQTPIWATCLMILVILFLALSFDLRSLAEATNYVLLSVFILINLSLLVIKKRDPQPKGVTRLPLIVPFLGLLFSAGVLILQLILEISN